jgi:preprotein translocase subunit YajC
MRLPSIAGGPREDTMTLFDFFVGTAHAQTAAPAGPSAGLLEFLPLLVLFIVFYFMLIRPQMKRQKEHRLMVDALAKGDEVVTSGGIAGKVTELGDSFLTVEIAKGIEVKVQRHAVGAVLPKGTLKAS